MANNKKRKTQKAFGETVLETNGKIPDLIGGSLGFMRGKPKKRKKNKR